MGKVDNPQEYMDRFKKEFSVVVKKNFATYFLVLKRVLESLKEKDIWRGIGRGCFTESNFVKLSNGLDISIKDVNIGDIVCNYFSKTAIILDKFEYDIDEEIIDIELESGKIISCTCDHKILTNRGWIEAKNLTTEDNIESIPLSI